MEGATVGGIVGGSVKGLSAATITLWKRRWEGQYAECCEGEWHGHEFARLWVDGTRRDGDRNLLAAFTAPKFGNRLLEYCSLG